MATPVRCSSASRSGAQDILECPARNARAAVNRRFCAERDLKGQRGQDADRQAGLIGTPARDAPSAWPTASRHPPPRVLSHPCPDHRGLLRQGPLGPLSTRTLTFRTPTDRRAATTYETFNDTSKTM